MARSNAKTNEHGLTDQQQRFCDRYLTHYNQRRAAIECGYSTDGTPDSTAPAVTARKMLQDPQVSAYIDGELKKAQLGKDEVLARLGAMSRCDLSAYLTEEARPVRNAEGEIIATEPYLRLNIRQLYDDGFGFLIKEISHSPFGPRVIFHDSMAALQLLGKAHRLFVDKIEASGPNGEPLKVLILDEKTNAAI